MTLRFRLHLVLLLALAAPLSGCLFRSRRPTVLMSQAPLQTATLPELVTRINAEAAKIQTLNATVEISASTGGSKKGKIIEYTHISGYILVRQPDMLRMIGLVPVVRNRAFDMVSNGKTFELSIPVKNRFYVGHNDVNRPNPSANPKQALENLRPQHIYDALLLRPVDPHSEIAVLEQGNQRVVDPKTRKEVLQPNYIVDVIRHGDEGWYLSRRITFDRTGLQPVRQRVYDRNGAVATDATYSDFKDYNDLRFPSVINIWRPQEEYSVTLTIEKLTLNQPLSNEQFVLNQPPGSQLIELDSATPRAAGDGSPK
jgi:outer membrane lipoprotein-sorting protein